MPGEVESKADKWFAQNPDIKIVEMVSNISANRHVITILYSNIEDQIKNVNLMKYIASAATITQSTARQDAKKKQD